MRIPFDKATKTIELLVEGCSVRSAERITDIHHTTILSLLVLAGEKCERLLQKRIKNHPVADVQCDEIWGYVGKKEAHKWMSEQGRDDIGDAYTFVAIERNTKLVLAWHLGKRTVPHTQAFIRKLATATAYQPYQLSTDGFPAYIAAVDDHLTPRGVDYGQLVKIYGASRDGEQRYSPPEVTSAVPHPVWGLPDVERICTSHVERQNLTMRMHMRRLTRLTNAFSKKWDNLKAAIALHFAWYNFVRVHKSLRMTPAMAAGITDHIWSLGELITEASQA